MQPSPKNEPAPTSQRLALCVAGPLAIGAAVYVLLRPREAHFVGWLGSISGPLGSVLHRTRSVTVPIGTRLPNVVLDVAPDLAWATALGALLAIVWTAGSRRAVLGWFAAGAIGSIGYELGQRWHVVPGTFDLLDLGAQTVGYVAGWALGRGRLRPTSPP